MLYLNIDLNEKHIEDSYTFAIDAEPISLIHLQYDVEVAYNVYMARGEIVYSPALKTTFRDVNETQPVFKFIKTTQYYRNIASKKGADREFMVIYMRLANTRLEYHRKPQSLVTALSLTGGLVSIVMSIFRLTSHQILKMQQHVSLVNQ